MPAATRAWSLADPRCPSRSTIWGGERGGRAISSERVVVPMLRHYTAIRTGPRGTRRAPRRDPADDVRREPHEGHAQPHPGAHGARRSAEAVLD